jgi:hypothetical protein
MCTGQRDQAPNLALFDIRKGIEGQRKGERCELVRQLNKGGSEEEDDIDDDIDDDENDEGLG